MNAYTTEPYGQSCFESSPVLIAGDSDAALQRAARTVEAAAPGSVQSFRWTPPRTA